MRHEGFLSEFLRHPEAHREHLLEIRDGINEALGETYSCSKCGRPLVIFQHLDYCEENGGKVCTTCSS